MVEIYLDFLDSLRANVFGKFDSYLFCMGYTMDENDT